MQLILNNYVQINFEFKILLYLRLLQKPGVLTTFSGKDTIYIHSKQQILNSSSRCSKLFGQLWSGKLIFPGTNESIYNEYNEQKLKTKEKRKDEV